ncbi:hypothetical protein PoB_001682000 [Plakobranchus ocellatus]|uniref:Apple domain-containing protein n=1 Tax=Plakobranchus ocellatus TaxID=259542 RepID=A0AAV3Z581_9GAST|nr:hypothetical protein PoB_001682000 [Plakobranchus ocellatus]
MQMWTLDLVAILATRSLSHQLGMVSIAISATQQSALNGNKLCQDLGYDGLGVLRTPEAYAYALRITKPLRLTEKAYFYVGLRRFLNPTRFVWDDGTTLATDMHLDKDYNYIGKISRVGTLRMITHLRWWRLMELQNVVANQPTQVSFKLSESTASSSIKCVVMCSQETLCRLPDFRADISTCTLFGPGTLNTTENAASTTFIRVAYEAMREEYS